MQVRTRSVAATFAALSLGALAPASAQPKFLALSLSDSATTATSSFDDEELIVASPGGAVRKLLSDQSLAFYLGDTNGDGKLDEPNDIDGLDVLPMPLGVPAIEGVFLSLVSDQGGILDGDIFRMNPASPSGVDILFAEAALVAAIGATDGNIDVDAFCVSDSGALYFSLAEDEDTATMGTLVDETVLLLPAGAAQAQVLYDAAAMTQMVQNALASSTAIGDVKALDLLGDDLLFTVQSPSSDDATVFSTAGGGSVYLAESAMNFTSAAEADALAVLTHDAWPSLTLDANVIGEGAAVTATLSGLTPGAPFVLFIGGSTIPGGSGISGGGFGALVLDPSDAIFQVAFQNATLLSGTASPTGDASVPGVAPSTSGAPFDLAIQALDATGRWSAPVVLELNQ